MRKFTVVAGFVCLALAAATYVWLRSASWQPATGFDVLGILWLLSNLPLLFVGAVAFLLGLFGIFLLWHAAVRQSPRARRDEEARLMSDSRFIGVLAHHARAPASGNAQARPEPSRTDGDEPS